MVARVLACLSEVIDIPIRPPLRVAGVHRIHERRFTALAWRRENHSVVIVGSGYGVDFTGHVRHKLLPGQQWGAEQLGELGNYGPVRPPFRVSLRSAAYRRHAFAFCSSPARAGLTSFSAGNISLSSWNHKSN